MSNLPLPLLVSNLCALASASTAKLAAVLLLSASNLCRVWKLNFKFLLGIWRVKFAVKFEQIYFANARKANLTL